MLFQIDPNQCVSCLACVRACPVEAVAVDGSDVEVIDEACIQCGACVPACPHDAVLVSGDPDRARELAPHGAVLILSVEAEVFFYPAAPEQVVNACYRAGFSIVHRGVLGDELVAERYRALWGRDDWGTMIRSTCPVVVETIRHHYPELVPFLAPVQTPVQAEAAYLRAKYGFDTRIVYAGVCIAEGGEVVDAAITLQELAELLDASGVSVRDQSQFFDRVPSERRRHVSTAGGLPLPVLQEEPMSSRRFRKMRGLGQLDAVARAVAVDEIDLGFVDILPCDGCLDHPLLGPPEELFWRRKVQQESEPPRSPRPVVERTVAVDLDARFEPATPPDTGVTEAEVADVIRRIGTAPGGRHWDCGACGFRTCRVFATALVRGRAALRQCAPYQERRAQQAQHEAAVDELTGLASYRVLQERLREEVARTRRTGLSFAVLFADLDRFKLLNDRYGHEAGNRVLAAVADALRRAVRGTDIAARYGGDEFVVLLVNTDGDGARKVAEEIRQSVAQAGTEAGFPPGTVSVSVGTSDFAAGAGDPQVLEAADRALYQAKSQGGNQVV